MHFALSAEAGFLHTKHLEQRTRAHKTAKRLGNMAMGMRKVLARPWVTLAFIAFFDIIEH